VNSSFELERFLRWQLEESSNTPEALVNSSELPSGQSSGTSGTAELKSIRGTEKVAIDAGGRIRLPASFIEALGNNPVLLYSGNTGRLQLMHSRVFDMKRREFAKLFSGDRWEQEDDYYAVTLGHLVECSIDGAGRIRIPVDTRELAGVEGSFVYLIGCENARCLIYSQAAYQSILSDSSVREKALAQRKMRLELEKLANGHQSIDESR
jgi:DNA-binding transcriptional regulator/RsmH inhibitor MraZ